VGATAMNDKEIFCPWLSQVAMQKHHLTGEQQAGIIPIPCQKDNCFLYNGFCKAYQNEEEKNNTESDGEGQNRLIF